MLRPATQTFQSTGLRQKFVCQWYSAVGAGSAYGLSVLAAVSPSILAHVPCPRLPAWSMASFSFYPRALIVSARTTSSCCAISLRCTLRSEQPAAACDSHEQQPSAATCHCRRPCTRGLVFSQIKYSLVLPRKDWRPSLVLD